jgi:hypothetical protein
VVVQEQFRNSSVRISTHASDEPHPHWFQLDELEAAAIEWTSALAHGMSPLEQPRVRAIAFSGMFAARGGNVATQSVAAEMPRSSAFCDDLKITNFAAGTDAVRIIVHQRKQPSQTLRLTPWWVICHLLWFLFAPVVAPIPAGAIFLSAISPASFGEFLCLAVRWLSGVLGN